MENVEHGGSGCCPACCGMDFGPWPQIVDALMEKWPTAPLAQVYANREGMVADLCRAGASYDYIVAAVLQAEGLA